MQISFYKLYKYFLTNKTDKEKYVKNKLKMNPIKSPELKIFYAGCDYLFQIWRNKKKIF